MNYVDILEYLCIFLYMIVMVFIIYFFKHDIYKKMYKDRYVQYHILDTGEHGYKIREKTINTFKDNEGNDRVFNRERKFNGILYYRHDEAEPVNIKFDKNLCKYFVDTDEFTIVLNNKVLEKLLIFTEGTYIHIILILCVLQFIALIYIVTVLGDIKDNIYPVIETAKSSGLIKVN